MASTFRFVWDGNVLLHETFKKDNSENTELTTWVFEGFVPTAKLVNGKAYSIISDHLGTPILAVDSEGNEVWNRQLDIYGRVKREIKASSLGDDVRPFIPFLYQGQYYDFETNLAYNRFRYYSPETGSYISQDPIGLEGNNPNLYAYVEDSNWLLDLFGLAKSSTSGNSSYAATGQEAHRQIENKLEKIGYTTEVPLQLSSGETVRKDGFKEITPKSTIVVIIKPNTRTGRREAKKREALMKLNNYKTFIWYYDPKDPKYQPGSSTYIGTKNKTCSKK